MGESKGAETRDGSRHLAAVSDIDRTYQRSIGILLGNIAAEYRKGEIDGIYVVAKLRSGRGLTHYRAAMMDVDVGWAGTSMVLSVHLEKR